jgi:cysteine-rich repeat protein
VAFALGCGPVVADEQDEDATSSEESASEGEGEGESDHGGVDHGTTGFPPSGCGDGIVDVGETCDDGDPLDGNGCNNDCRPSGQLLWADRFDGGESDYGNAVGLDAAGNVWLGASSSDAEPRQNAVLRAYTAAGELRWQATAPQSDTLHQTARALAVDADGTVTMAITSNTPELRSVAEIVQWDFAGGQRWSTRRSLVGGSVAPVGLVIDTGGRLLAAGTEWLPSGSPSLFLEAYQGDALQWTSATPLAQWPNQLLAGADEGGLVALATGGAEAGTRLLRFDGAGGFGANDELPCGHVIASDVDGTVWAAGDDGFGMLTVCALASNGSPGPAFSFAAAEFWVSAIAVADGGDVVLVGYVIDSPSFMRVERRAPDGQLRWAYAPEGETQILPFAVATRPGVASIAISGITLEDEADAMLLVLSP